MMVTAFVWVSSIWAVVAFALCLVTEYVAYVLTSKSVMAQGTRVALVKSISPEAYLHLYFLMGNGVTWPLILYHMVWPRTVIRIATVTIRYKLKIREQK